MQHQGLPICFIISCMMVSASIALCAEQYYSNEQIKSSWIHCQQIFMSMREEHQANSDDLEQIKIEEERIFGEYKEIAQSHISSPNKLENLQNIVENFQVFLLVSPKNDLAVFRKNYFLDGE